MITIYKDKKDILKNREYIELNDIFFNQNTALKLDHMANNIIEQIDDSKWNGKYKIESKFSGVTLDVDCLSTGCKTVLNVLYFPDKIFCLKECGENALEVLYGLKDGAVYSNYAVMPFDINKVQISDEEGIQVIADYEELKQW
ncbi:MAG: DUF4869 domain-containing protein [Eubacteriales bacterium]